MPTRVYLNYAPADEAFAARLREDLRAAGEDVVTPSPEFDGLDLNTSDSLSKINQSLSERDVMAVVLSPDALSSPRVNRELYVASGRATTGGMRPPVLVTARTVNGTPLPNSWSRLRSYDATADYGGALPRIVRAVDGTENAPPKGFAALVDGKGFSLQNIWERLGVRGVVIVVAAFLAIFTFAMPWFSVGIACEDQGCSLTNAVIAPGPNDVDGYYLASDKNVSVNTGTAHLDSAGVKIQNGYAENNGVFDPKLPRSITDGTQTIVLNNQLTFTTTPQLSFTFSLLRFFLPLAAISLLLPLFAAVVGLKPLFSKLLILLPILLELVLLVVYIAAAPEAFHSSELIHFAPGPGGGAWLAFLLTLVMSVFGLSISTKPPTQKV